MNTSPVVCLEHTAVAGAAPERRKLRTVCQPTVFRSKEFVEIPENRPVLVAFAQHGLEGPLCVASLVKSTIYVFLTNRSRRNNRARRRFPRGGHREKRITELDLQRDLPGCAANCRRTVAGKDERPETMAFRRLRSSSEIRAEKE